MGEVPADCRIDYPHTQCPGCVKRKKRCCFRGVDVAGVLKGQSFLRRALIVRADHAFSRGEESVPRLSLDDDNARFKPGLELLHH